MQSRQSDSAISIRTCDSSIMFATGQASIAVPFFLAVLALLLCGVALRAGVQIGKADDENDREDQPGT